MKAIYPTGTTVQSLIDMRLTGEVVGHAVVGTEVLHLVRHEPLVLFRDDRGDTSLTTEVTAHALGNLVEIRL